MASLWAFLPAPEAARLYDTVSRIADELPDDRTLCQRRADALVGLAEMRVDPTLRPQVSVTVPISTLMGVGDEPAEVAGLGPISAEVAQELAAGGTWRRLLTDPRNGAVLDVGRSTYRPPAALAETVRVRDRTCRFPGCRRSALRCDLDHTVPFPQGPTAVHNLAALCRRHHLLKHNRQWSVCNDDGVLHWTSPTGHRYRTDPPVVAAPVAAAPKAGVPTTADTLDLGPPPF